MGWRMQRVRAGGHCGSAIARVRALRGVSGQMTVELAVVLPVMLALAFVATNALLYLGDCAAFDMVARDAIRLQADNAFENGDGAAQVRRRIEDGLACDYESVTVQSQRSGLGHVTYTAAIEFSPPFLRGAQVFGIAVPALRHEVSFVISPYRKGVII